MSEKKAKAGWYENKGVLEYWDGGAWTGRTKAGSKTLSMSPNEYLWIGVAISVASGGFAFVGTLVGDDAQASLFLAASVVGFLGWIVLSIGIVAKGVQIGRDHSA